MACFWSMSTHRQFKRILSPKKPRSQKVPRIRLKRGPSVVYLIMEVLVITPDWTVPYIAYILRKELPENEEEARQIVRRSKAFTVMKGQLYRESATGANQKCITPEEGRIILNDIHSGTCGHHASSRTIVAKAYRAGFYWPEQMKWRKR